MTVVGSYVDFLGNPPTEGVLTFEVNASHLKHLDSDLIIFGGTRTVNLQPDGSFTIVLPVTNDPDVVPTFQYNVTETIKGGTTRRFSIDLPISMLPGPVNLADIIVIGTPPSGSNALTKEIADTLYALKGSTGEPGGGTGTDGREVQLRNSGAAIQWRYSGTTDWTDLVALSVITGTPGTNGAPGAPGTDGAPGGPGADGTNGREVQLNNTGSVIQWRYAGEAFWTDLIQLSTLVGAKGEPGVKGDPGQDGAPGVVDPEDITSAVATAITAKFPINATSGEQAAAPIGTIFLFTEG